MKVSHKQRPWWEKKLLCKVWHFSIWQVFTHSHSHTWGVRQKTTALYQAYPEKPTVFYKRENRKYPSYRMFMPLWQAYSASQRPISPARHHVLGPGPRASLCLLVRSKSQCNSGPRETKWYHWALHPRSAKVSAVTYTFLRMLKI